MPETDAAADTCSIVPKTVTDLARTHVAVCSQVSYPDNPPAGGSHYPVWAAFQSYSFPVPRGFWVHDLEHGAIVFSYNCLRVIGGLRRRSCPSAVVDRRAPSRPRVFLGNAARVVLTPDPLLDVRWGVSAWGSTLRADCVDEQLFGQFYLDHFGKGPEDFCDFRGQDFGGTPPCQ